MKRVIITEEVKSLAVARILSGRATVEEIAKEFKVTVQAVRAWKRERRPPATATPPPPKSVSPSLQGSAPSPGPSSSTPAPKPDALKDPLAAARAAAGIGPAAPGAPPPITEDVLRQADEADRRLVIQTAIDLKSAGLELLATRAGLSSSDPALKKISGLTPIAAAALQANASWIAPIIREKVQGKLALIVALGIEAFVTFAAFKAILEARGLLKPKEAPAEEEKKPAEAAHA